MAGRLCADDQRRVPEKGEDRGAIGPIRARDAEGPLPNTANRGTAADANASRDDERCHGATVPLSC